MRFSIGGILREVLGFQKRLIDLEHKLENRNALLESKIDYVLSAFQDVSSQREKPMVVPFLTGGLGNQLFQLSCAYNYARIYDYKFRVNYSLYACYGQGQHALRYRETLYQNIESTDLDPKYRYNFPHHRYSEILRLPRVDVKLEGGFQSSRYFAKYREEVRHLFVLPKADLESAKSFLALDESRPVVGIHIRLGDYANHRGLQAFAKSYYLKAAALFPRNSRFIVCSDEPDLACEILRSEQKSNWFSPRLIDPEVYRGSSELADLALLSLCNNLILSNSTFSYWGYFLGVAKTKVVAPKRWFSDHINGDIYEKEWILI